MSKSAEVRERKREEESRVPFVCHKHNCINFYHVVFFYVYGQSFSLWKKKKNIFSPMQVELEKASLSRSSDRLMKSNEELWRAGVRGYGGGTWKLPHWSICGVYVC